MSEAFDPFWQDAAKHVRQLGLSPNDVLAPGGFQFLLQGCYNGDNAPALSRLKALILHKGRLEEVPAEHLVSALDSFVPTFANEVFIVLSREGAAIEPGSPHMMDREQLILNALLASDRKSTRDVARARVPATQMGEGRVLLETAFGHLMLVDGSDIAIVPHLIRDGCFDRNLTDIIGTILQPGMTFIDVGANFGTYTLIGAAQVGEEGRVIAVEPAPAIAALLFATLSMNGYLKRTELLRCALGASDGVQTLYEFATLQGSNTLLADVAETARANFNEDITTREVECRTLDGIVDEQALDRIDLVKIDVEGFEYEVLQGAREALLQFRPQLILEWHTDFFDGRPEAARALYQLLTEELAYGLNRIDADANIRAIGFDELMQLEHSDLLARPSQPADGAK
ncbi:FkbM family methyltransferase [Altererythrobacter sp. GH1-8]|uniref:FkbM family methyltransferase n=1 Tax=Altererythrobacter sp. GH1-8 TaxID=3349333 RepID=UPI00374DE18A